MRFVWLSALKDLRRLRRDPVGLALWIGIPLFVMALMYVVFGRGDVKPEGRLLVADEDSSFVSALVIGAFRQGPLAEMLLVEKLPRQQGEQKLRRGDASALLIIPKGFGSAVLREEPSRLTLITNPAQRILPAMIEETLSILVDGVFYLQALAGEELRTLAKGPPGGAGAFPDATIAEISVRMSRIGQSLAGWLEPPRIQLETELMQPSSPLRANFAAALGPGMVFLALLFIAQGLSADFWKERGRGTLRRLLGSPRPVSSLVAGKLLAAAAVLCIVSLAGLACVLWAAGMPADRLLPGVLWSTASGALFFLLLALLQIHATSERAASTLGNLVLFPMVLLGSFFPLEMMPESLARIGRITPNGWALTQLKSILEGAADAGRLALAAALLLAVGAAAFLAAARRLSRGFAL